ncbi:DUF2795 domain-containing protein [Solwaraspora sp. WMMD406]|uniref:DUF2795 domain-containing protein n=1 Tax=Solwaraspora sp. WMMD406 TaxID=3016095 RepID=UPI002416BFAE|nr:DUF2795 domain-containing protein [Solwaraspora sp. WMMD406]MDG4766611.1 DUF2795 domain-containing protein [Solwaraspora sp. WMMD406]
MERGNSKHGPRVDESMAHEVRGTTQGTAGGRAEEWHEAEPPGEDQPEPTTVPAGDNRSGAPQGMTNEEVEQRSRLGRYINLSALPGDRTMLRDSARENEAPADVLAEIDQLPAGRTFRTVSEVWAALGHANETTRW